MILFPFFATLTLPVVSDRRSAKYSLIRFRSYHPELNPRTGTWSHHSTIWGAALLEAPSRRQVRTLLVLWPAPLQLFHELADQLCRVSFTDVQGLSFKGVSDAHRNRHVLIFDRERRCQFLSLIFVTVRLEIVKDRVWEALHLGAWQLHIYFPYFTRPCLDYPVSRSSEHSCALNSCFVPVFTCLVIVSNNFITIIRVTFSASVPVTAVVLKYSPCFGVVSVHRDAVPACHVVNVNFLPRGFLFEPAKRFWRSCMFWIEGLLESCLRCFDSFGQAIDHRLPLGTRFGMPLKVGKRE